MEEERWHFDNDQKGTAVSVIGDHKRAVAAAGGGSSSSSA